MAITTWPQPHDVANGKGHAAFATWPLFKPATTYSPTHVWRGRPRPRDLSLVGENIFPWAFRPHVHRSQTKVIGPVTLRAEGGRGGRPTQSGLHVYQPDAREVPVPQTAPALAE